MDGIHDLGGMHGFGAVSREADEPVFHENWEGRVFAINLALLAQGKFNTDQFRFAIERMDPGHYLRSGYYEHWLDGVTRLLREAGLLGEGEIESRMAAPGRGRQQPSPSAPSLAEALRQGIRVGASTRRDDGRAPRFRIGDTVVVRRMHPSGHTRCPRYVRGARGAVIASHGSFVFPDASAAGGPASAEPLHTVRFEAAELWGGGEAGERVFVDLWERYLEPA